jgi:hypothetical protein
MGIQIDIKDIWKSGHDYNVGKKKKKKALKIHKFKKSTFLFLFTWQSIKTYSSLEILISKGIMTYGNLKLRPLYLINQLQWIIVIKNSKEAKSQESTCLYSAPPPHLRSARRFPDFCFCDGPIKVIPRYPNGIRRSQ